MVEHEKLTLGQCATLACLLEVTVPKPGNVHRGADFGDLTFTDFALSAVAIGPAMDQASRQPVGVTVERAVRATRQLVATNTNLGIVLLLAPLAAVPRDERLDVGIRRVLGGLAADDSRHVYRAIRLAVPGGLGTVDTMDLGGPPPDDLRQAMRKAARWDDVAAQYVTDFVLVLREVVPQLADACGRWGLVAGVIYVHVSLLAGRGDSLIARKCGPAVAAQAAAWARRVLDAGGPEDTAYLDALGDLDFWLRSDGNRRNPGTTADLVTAGLFCGLREGWLPVRPGQLESQSGLSWRGNR
jgi:triphosphoribosyl-dephospho-CoA synthase